MSSLKEAERLLDSKRVGILVNSQVLRAQAICQLSIAKSLEYLVAHITAPKLIEGVTVPDFEHLEVKVVARTGWGIAVQCPNYQEKGGCFHKGGAGHGGECLSAGAAAQHGEPAEEWDVQP